MKFIGFVTESNNFCRTHKGARKKRQKFLSENLKTRLTLNFEQEVSIN